MRKNIKEFVQICAETLSIEDPIFEFGSFQVPTQIGFADLRPLFPNAKYIGADMRDGPGVDMVLDLHDIALPSNTVGTVLLLDTLEHVEYPRQAIKEIYRILKPDGIIIISSVMNFPIHDHPFDYWRYTPEGFKSLLGSFSKSVIEFAGDSTLPHTVVGIGFKGEIDEKTHRELTNKLKAWRQLNSIKPWEKLVKMFIPPIILMFRKKLMFRKNDKFQ